MNLLSHSLLFVTVLLVTLQGTSEACSCLRSHPQQLFCNADIVIRAKIINKTIHCEDSIDCEVQYKIKMFKMFKGFNKLKDVDSVYTPAESSMCGVQLNDEQKLEYLLAGHFRDNKVMISLCGLSIPWQEVSNFQSKSLTYGTYKKGCVCKVRICSVELCDNHAPNECFWNDWDYVGGWLAENSACVPGKGGSCSWQSSPGAKQPIYESHP